MAGSPIPETPSWLSPLVERAHADRTRETVLVAHDLTFARDTIRLVARAVGGVAGWRPDTIRGVAGRLARPVLEREQVRTANDLELRALIVEALLDVVRATRFARVRRLVDRPGFRTVIADAVLALRAGGVPSADARAVAEGQGDDAPALLSAEVLRQYESLLESRRVADAGHVLLTALGEPNPDALKMVLTPTLAGFGLSARLAEAWRQQGAVALAHASSPRSTGWEFARAASPTDEVRHVLRTLLLDGAPWDALEVAATDYETYAVAIADEAASLGIPVSLRDGLPLARSRLGRAIAGWFAWVRDGLPLAAVRSAVLAGEWCSPIADVGAADVAEALRRLHVGWGRSRWDDARERMDPHPGLAALLSVLFEALPPVPDREDPEAGRGDVPTLARALDAALDVMRARDTVTAAHEEPAMERVRERLSVLAALSAESLPFGAALATVEESLADVRWWPPLSSDDPAGVSRASRPGAVHVVPITDAGVTGRPITALVGMDAERMAGATLGDVVLVDDVRAALGGTPMRVPTLAARTEWFLGQVGRAVERPVGRILATWTSVVPGSARDIAPDRRILAAYRQALGDPQLDNEKLRKAVGAPIGAIPLSGVLDARDAWLVSIVSEGGPKDAATTIGAVFPGIADAAAIEAVYGTAEPHATFGFVPSAAGRVGPPAGLSISATSLERFGRCGLRWFYHDALRVRAPDDDTWTPGEWLDAATRGTWLHTVFERAGRAASAGTLDLSAASAFADVHAMLLDVVAEEEGELPVPPPAVRRRELAQLETIVRQWLAMMQDDRQAGATWVHHELDLAPDWHHTRVRFSERWEVRLHGRVDRVDQLADGSWRIVDYKTGKARGRPSGKAGPFEGGRYLQGPVYAAGAASALGVPVEAFAYWFPTATGDERIFALSGDELEEGHRLITGILDDMAAGRFIATDDAMDCRSCDQAPICRAVQTGNYSVESPRAAWVKAQLEQHPELVPLKRRRMREETP